MKTLIQNLIVQFDCHQIIQKVRSSKCSSYQINNRIATIGQNSFVPEGLQLTFESVDGGVGSGREWLRSRLQRLNNKATDWSERARAELSDRAKDLRPAVTAAGEHIKGAARTAWRGAKGHLRQALQKGADALADDEAPARSAGKQLSDSKPQESRNRQNVVILYRDPEREQPLVQQMLLKPSGFRSQ